MKYKKKMKYSQHLNRQRLQIFQIGKKPNPQVQDS